MYQLGNSLYQPFKYSPVAISKLRHSLSDKSAQAATVLGSWSSLEGVIPKAHIIQLFKDKSKWPKKKQKTVKATEPESNGSVILMT